MATLVAWWARLAAYTRRHEQAGARGEQNGRFAGLSTFDWYKLSSWLLEGLKTKKRVKFGYIEKKPYLCTVLVAERLRSDNPAIAPRRRLIRGELVVSGAPLAAGVFVY